MKRSRSMVKSDASSDNPSISNEADGQTTQTVSKSLNAQTVAKKMAASSLQQKTAATGPQQSSPLVCPRPQQQQLQQSQKQRLSLPLSAMKGSAATPKPTVSSITNSVASLLSNPNTLQKSLSPQQPSDLPRSSPCGACGTTVPVSAKSMKQHPKLHIVICASCYRFYHTGKWKRDADGHFIHCQCCADGGNMVCCSRCDQVACRSCLKRILGRKELAAALDKDWLCLVCQPHQMSTFLSNSLRAIGALRQKSSAETRLGFSPQHSKSLANGSSSSSASSPIPSSLSSAQRMMLGGFKPPATINAFFPAQSRSQTPSTTHGVAASSGASTTTQRPTPSSTESHRTNSLVTSTKNLADDFLCDGWNDSEAARAQRDAISSKADDDVVILDSSPTVARPSAPVPKPTLPKASLNHPNGLSFPTTGNMINRNPNFNRSNFNNASNNVGINRMGVNNVNSIVNNNNNLQSRKTIEQGVSYLDQRLKNWRSLLDKMVRNHSVNGPVKGKVPLSPRSLKPDRPAHDLRKDFTAMISKMKKEIESLERNLLNPPSSVNVVHATSFQPPAARHLQRGSPDLHGRWMLPQENKTAPKSRAVSNDDSDLDDDSDEEEEKAVIRIGSGFQAIIPEKREAGAKLKPDEERAEDMLLWHPYGLLEAKTEDFLEKAAISAKGDLQLALYLLMKSDFDTELAMKSLELQQQQQQQQQPQQQQHLTKRQRLAGTNEKQSDEAASDKPSALSSETSISSIPMVDSASSSSSSVSANASVSAPSGGQSLITKFLSTRSAVDAVDTTTTTTTTVNGEASEQDGIGGRKPIHDVSESTSSIIQLDAEADVDSDSARPSTPTTRSGGVSSPQKYATSLNIINGVVQTREPRPEDDDNDGDASPGSLPMVETAQVRRWTEAECYAFECGLRAHGKDFNDIRKHRLPGRSVAEIVQFYYLWKKTERRNFVDL